MKTLLLNLTVLSQLIACQIVHSPQPVIQVPLMKKFATGPVDFEAKNYELVPTEIKTIPDNKEIDPLTDYIELYKEDLVMYPYVKKVTIKRDEKCQQVTDYYKNKPLNSTLLDEVAENYSYSCPYLVADFIDTLESDEK